MALSFADLNDDVKYDVFKYLSMIERVQFERVNLEWQKIIDLVWHSQLALRVSSWPFDPCVHGVEESCDVVCHQVRKKDEFSLGQKDGHTRLPFFVLLVIISKCINLKALHLHFLHLEYQMLNTF